MCRLLRRFCIRTAFWTLVFLVTTYAVGRSATWPGTQASVTKGDWFVGPATPLPLSGQGKHLWASAAPDDPDRVIACVFESDGEQARQHSVVYVSFDGGNTWMETLDDAASDWVSEPSCALGSDNKAYFVASVSNTWNGVPHHGRGSTELFRSFDGGLHWTEPQRFPFIDWTSLAVSDSQTNDVYVFGHSMAQGIGDRGIGKWNDKIRPVLASHDGGETFPVLAFPPDQEHNSWRGGYPLSSLAIEDASAFVLYGQSTQAVPVKFGKMAYSLYWFSHGVYEKVGDVGLPQEVQWVHLFAAQMAVDRSKQHPGRLYVAFSGIASNHAVLGLSVSDDVGKSWKSRILLRGEERAEAPNSMDFSPLAGVAVNGDGALGIEWMPPNGCPLFDISLDGGDSTALVKKLGKCEERDPASLLARATAKSLNGLRASNVGREISEDEAPGFTFQVDTGLLFGAQVVADAAGRFHVFWPQRESDGSTAILTGTITQSSSPIPAPSLIGRVDLTSNTAIQVLKSKYDSDTAVFAIDVVARNITTSAIAYPSMLEGARDLSHCGKIDYLNALTSTDSGRPVYRIATPPYTEYLRPGEKTLPVHLQIHIAGCEDGASLFNRSRVIDEKTQTFFTLLWVNLHTYGPASSGGVAKGRR